MRGDALRLFQGVGRGVGVEAALDHLLARGGCQVDGAHGQCRATNHANTIQAAMKQTPPIGVIAPSARFPVTASRYKLPEKITIPASSSPQTHDVANSEKVPVLTRNDTMSNPSAWMEW